MNDKKKSHKHLEVVLGSASIKAFVTAPKEYAVLGIVRIGKEGCPCMEFGLLATNEAGNYVRVNGSTVSPLRTEAVEAALREARNHGRGESFAQTRLHATFSMPKVTVTVRKRRHAAEHLECHA